MSYVDQHTSSTASSVHGNRPSSPLIATRMTFERGHLPHMGQSLSQSIGQAAPGTRPVIAIAAPAKLHRDVSTRFGERLKELRTERHLTQVRMAREFGVDRSYISDLERGRKSISLPTMEIFALGLKLSLAELLTGI